MAAPSNRQLLALLNFIINSPECHMQRSPFVEKARPRKDACSLRTNHGGVCLLFDSSLHADDVDAFADDLSRTELATRRCS